MDIDSDPIEAGNTLSWSFHTPASPDHTPPESPSSNIEPLRSSVGTTPTTTPTGSPKPITHSQLLNRLTGPTDQGRLESPPVTPPVAALLPPPPPPAPIMGDVDALKDAITDAFQDIRGVSIPLPQFHGKKGEKPEEHCLKVKDYFKDLKITTHANKIAKFKATLCGKARQWLEDLRPKPTEYSHPDTDPIADIQATLKYKFVQRWSIKGRPPEALYSEWQNLKFDPATDDAEEFISDVISLAKSLGYPDTAQVMAIKNCMPMEVFTMCLNTENLNDLRKTLIKVFDNPKVKRNYAATTGATATPSAFSMARYGLDDPQAAASDDMGKLMSKFDSLEYSIRKMSIADPRKRQPKYKPEVTPPQHRGGQSRGRRGRHYDQCNDRSQFDMSRQNYQSKGNFNSRGRGRGRGHFDNSPNVRHPRIASRTPDKDKMRCHYCKEFGHFIKNCRKRLKDEERAAKLHVMTPVTLQQETVKNSEDYYAYDDDELDEHTTEHLNN